MTTGPSRAIDVTDRDVPAPDVNLPTRVDAPDPAFCGSRLRSEPLLDTFAGRSVKQASRRQSNEKDSDFPSVTGRAKL